MFLKENARNEGIHFLVKFTFGQNGSSYSKACPPRSLARALHSHTHLLTQTHELIVIFKVTA